MMNKRNMVIAGVVLVTVLVLMFLYRPSLRPGEEQVNGSQTWRRITGEVTVPDADSEDVPANVAKPELVASGSADNSVSLRIFSVRMEGDLFIPDSVVVRQKDTVRLTIWAVDKDYDFAQPDYGFGFEVPKGEKKTLEFSATLDGEFKFFCKSCGGPAKGPAGYFVVAPETNQ